MAIRYGAKLADLARGDKLANPVIAKSLAAGAAAIGADQHYTVLGEDFTVELNQTPKKWVSNLADPVNAIFSTIYAGSIYHFSEKLNIQQRALNVSRALDIFSQEAVVLEATLKSIDEDIKVLGTLGDFDEMRRYQGRITAKGLKAQRLTRAMENNINALLYLGKAESDDILLETLKEANLEDNVDDLKVWQSWVDNPPKGIIDDKMLGILNQLADPDDLMGIKAAVNKSKVLNDDIIQFLTRVEQFGDDADALLKNPKNIEKIDELGRALSKLGQGEVAGFFARTKEGIKNVTATMKTIATASADARRIGQRASFTAKTVGRFFFWDTAYWVVTLGVDIALNPFLPEDKQRIPYLADLPLIGGLFDVSETAGTSPLNLVIDWAVGGIIDWFVPDSIAESFYNLLNGAVDSEDLAVWYFAVITFFYDLQIDITLENLTIETPQDLTFDVGFPIPRIDPLDVLAYIAVGCIVKVVFKGWVVPAWQALQGTVNSAT
jgi:hypothetical protein